MSKEEPFEIDNEYLKFLQEIKRHIQTSRMKVALAVNSELLKFYWALGRMILDRQSKSNWGDKMIHVLARDLKSAYPDSKGFSPTNLKYMRIFAETYSDNQIGQTVSGQLPWSHHVILLKRSIDLDERS